MRVRRCGRCTGARACIDARKAPPRYAARPRPAPRGGLYGIQPMYVHLHAAVRGVCLITSRQQAAQVFIAAQGARRLVKAACRTRCAAAPACLRPSFLTIVSPRPRIVSNDVNMCVLLTCGDQGGVPRPERSSGCVRLCARGGQLRGESDRCFGRRQTVEAGSVRRSAAIEM